jgi:hypothetical protein
LEILPQKCTIFGKLTMKIRHFWKILPWNKIFSENLPFYGNFSMEIGTLGLLLCINGSIDRMLSGQVKWANFSNITAVNWLEWPLAMPKVSSSNPAKTFII